MPSKTDIVCKQDERPARPSLTYVFCQYLDNVKALPHSHQTIIYLAILILGGLALFFTPTLLKTTVSGATQKHDTAYSPLAVHCR